MTHSHHVDFPKWKSLWRRLTGLQLHNASQGCQAYTSPAPAGVIYDLANRFPLHEDFHFKDLKP
jgi:hypothetical protein